MADARHWCAGDKLRIGLQKGLLSLPKARSVPIVCIGPGTGVAPMRAIIEERVLAGSKGASPHARAASAEHDRPRVHSVICADAIVQKTRSTSAAGLQRMTSTTEPSGLRTSRAVIWRTASRVPETGQRACSGHTCSTSCTRMHAASGRPSARRAGGRTSLGMHIYLSA